jgi:uncharacterized OB-fold protein
MFKWFGLVNYAPHTKVAEFARHLKNGRLVGTKCAECGATTFPPRADCAECMSPQFEFVDVSGKGTLHTFTTIVAAPTGFEHLAPYVLGLVDLDDGGRALAWIGPTVNAEDIEIGMELQVVPQIAEESEEIRVYYSLERPGTTWPRTQPSQ